MYGKQIMSDLSTQLTQRYGNGFSVPNLQNFRKFYLAYSTRVITAAPIQYPTGTELPHGFSPHLSWSHYRALMRVENGAAREEIRVCLTSRQRNQIGSGMQVTGDQPWSESRMSYARFFDGLNSFNTDNIALVEGKA